MTAISRASATMQKLVKLNNEIQSGAIVSPHELSALHGELTLLYYDVSLELGNAFGPRERSYLSRKTNQAKHYEKFRNGEQKMTSKDAETAAQVSSWKDADEEITRAETYEQTKLLLASIDRAIDFVRSLIASYRNQERNA